MKQRPSKALAACVFLTILGSCSGSGSSPTEPASPAAPVVANATHRSVATQWGNLQLNTGDCSEVDLDQIVASIDEGYARARRQVGSVVDSIRLDGLIMTGYQDLSCGGIASYGCYFFAQDVVRFRCGSENVINHELQHRFCDRLSNPCDCTQTDHPGGNDLSCSPV